MKIILLFGPKLKFLRNLFLSLTGTLGQFLVLENWDKIKKCLYTLKYTSDEIGSNSMLTSNSGQPQ